MRRTAPFYPKNPYIQNGVAARVYLAWLRRGWQLPAKTLGLVLGCELACPLPERLFLPHPNGVIADTHCRLGNDVVLRQQVTLGVARPYYDHRLDPLKVDPILEDGVYVGPGAKILGRINIGTWSVIGANAVVTIDVPPNSIVVGFNRLLEKPASDLPWVPDPSAAISPS